MSDLDRYLLLCDPVPEEAARIKGWRQAVQGVARIILDPQQSSPWEMAEILARITVERRPWIGSVRHQGRYGRSEGYTGLVWTQPSVRLRLRDVCGNSCLGKP